MPREGTGIKKMENPPSGHLITRSQDINDFYTTKAWENSIRFYNVVYEYWLNGEVVGFVTACMSKLRVKIDEDWPEFNYPAVLIGRLGVDQSHNGNGYGKELVEFILALAHEHKEEIGCRIVYLDVSHIEDDSGKKVENERLIRYYINLGFERSNVQQRKNKLISLFFDLKSDIATE